jgi:hypothetical protein
MSPQKAYFRKLNFFNLKPCSFRDSTPQPTVASMEKLCTNRYCRILQAKKAPSVRPLSQHGPKKGLFYYIRTQVFVAYYMYWSFMAVL